jgi:hypothetical protein
MGDGNVRKRVRKIYGPGLVFKEKGKMVLLVE